MIDCSRKAKLKALYNLACKERARRQAEMGKYDWEKLSREKQKLPKGKWRIWLILAGRGFGKTRAGAEAIRKLVNSGKYKNIGLIANTHSDAREVMVEGESGLLAVTPKNEGLHFEPSQRLLKWDNGAKARIYSAENKEQLRGPQFDCVWIDELAKFRKGEEVMNQVHLCLRLGKDPKIIITTTPRPTRLIKSLCKMPGVALTVGSTYENAKNLSKQFIKYIENEFEGTSVGAQEIHAQVIDNDKSWWTHEMIEKTRIDSIPKKFKKVVIGVDPAVTNNCDSDETGIVVSAIDHKGLFYILDDASGKFDTPEWCKNITELYKKYKADEIVIETNAGGDIPEQMIHIFDPTANIKKVHAKKGKSMRAEPILSLYQQKRIFHIKPFVKLEQQMLTYPDTKKSPDRLDALVWAVKSLVTKKAPEKIPNVFLI